MSAGRPFHRRRPEDALHPAWMTFATTPKYTRRRAALARPGAALGRRSTAEGSSRAPTRMRAAGVRGLTTSAVLLPRSCCRGGDPPAPRRAPRARSASPAAARAASVHLVVAAVAARSSDAPGSRASSDARGAPASSAARPARRSPPRRCALGAFREVAALGGPPPTRARARATAGAGAARRRREVGAPVARVDADGERASVVGVRTFVRDRRNVFFRVVHSDSVRRLRLGRIAVSSFLVTAPYASGAAGVSIAVLVRPASRPPPSAAPREAPPRPSGDPVSENPVSEERTRGPRARAPSHPRPRHARTAAQARRTARAASLRPAATASPGSTVTSLNCSVAPTARRQHPLPQRGVLPRATHRRHLARVPLAQHAPGSVPEHAHARVPGAIRGGRAPSPPTPRGRPETRGAIGAAAAARRTLVVRHGLRPCERRGGGRRGVARAGARHAEAAHRRHGRGPTHGLGRDSRHLGPDRLPAVVSTEGLTRTTSAHLGVPRNQPRSDSPFDRLSSGGRSQARSDVRCTPRSRHCARRAKPLEAKLWARDATPFVGGIRGPKLEARPKTRVPRTRTKRRVGSTAATTSPRARRGGDVIARADAVGVIRDVATARRVSSPRSSPPRDAVAASARLVGRP